MDQEACEFCLQCGEWYLTKFHSLFPHSRGVLSILPCAAVMTVGVILTKSKNRMMFSCTRIGFPD